MSHAWLFPGQGTQSVGMGKEVLAASAAARRVFERVDAALGEPLSEVILNGPEEALTRTANAQPAILAVSCAVLAALRERMPDVGPPALAAGHSLGEYTALVAADALALEDAARLVRARGVAMQQAVAPEDGAMCAIIGVDRDRLDAICAEAAQSQIVSPANFNAPGQIVIAGHAAAVTRAAKIVTAQHGRAIPLKVSAPFHCALMAPAATVLSSILESVRVKAPSFPVVSNVDALPNSDPEKVKDLLVRQVDGPVRWEESIRLMAASGVTHALEIGPSRVLSGLVKRITPELKVLSVGDCASLESVATFLQEQDVS